METNDGPGPLLIAGAILGGVCFGIMLGIAATYRAFTAPTAWRQSPAS